MLRLFKKFPIVTNRIKIRIINMDDIEWYASSIRQPYINKYNDGDISNIGYEKIISNLINLVMSYKIYSPTINQIRTVIEYNGVRIGGISIFKTNESNIYELGYWILMEYHGNGFAYETLTAVTAMLLKHKYIKAVRLVIHDNNTKSKNLALKAGYKLVGSFQGKKTINLVYERRGLHE